MNKEQEESHGKKIEMWKKKEELLNAMSENELRAFIKGYMMGQKFIFKQMGSGCECGCQEGSSCEGNECNCEKK